MKVIALGYVMSEAIEGLGGDVKLGILTWREGEITPVQTRDLG